MKTLNPVLQPEALQTRLQAFANSVIAVVSHEENVLFGNAFEHASDEFGLAHGVGKLIEKTHLLTALAKDGLAQVKGYEFLDGLDKIIGDALLLRDYIQRNGHLVTDGKAPEVTLVPSTPINHESLVEHLTHAVAGIVNEVKDEVASTVEKVEEFFTPDIPATTEGEDTQNAR